MAQKFLTSIDLNKNELRNARLQNLATAPSSPVLGQRYFDTTDGVGKEWNGTAWIAFDAAKVPNAHIPLAKLATDPLARANHTGTQLAATISDFDAQVRTNRLDQMAAPTTDVSLNSQKITNLANGAANSDAATVGQVAAAIDAAVAGLDWKEAVRVIAQSNITLSGLQTIDGVTLAADERVLVAGQTLGQNNGIYLAKSGAWVRSSDADTAADIANMSVLVAEGTSGQGTQWKLTTDGITLGTTPLVFVQHGAGASAYTAGNGLVLSGNDFNVGAGNGIIADADQVRVDPNVVARKYGALIGDGSSVSIAVTHSLNSTDVVVSVRDASTGEVVICDVTYTSANVVTLGFSSAPASNALRATVIG